MDRLAGEYPNTVRKNGVGAMRRRGLCMKVAEVMLPVQPILFSRLTLDRVSGLDTTIDFYPVVDEQKRYLGIVEGRSLHTADADSLDGLLRTDRVPCIALNADIDMLHDNLGPSVVVDEYGQVHGIITQDLALEVLRNSFREAVNSFSAVIDSSLNGVLAVDREGRIRIANRVVTDMAGLPRDGLIGRPVTEVIPNTRLIHILQTGQSLANQKIIIGSNVVMSNYSPILSQGEVVGAVSIFQDISLLENISAELSYVKGLSSELEAIINSSYDGMFITDGDGMVLRINTAYERITGIRADEVVGKYMGQLVEEKYYDESVTLLVMRSREPITINQTVKNGRRLLVTGNPIFDESGSLFRVVTNVRDVTELTHLQMELTRTEEEKRKYKAELSHLRSMQLADNQIIFRSRSMEQAIGTAVRVAEVDSTVLIMGDSGTGKEEIAKLIHNRGKGIARPFIKINCAALPEQLLESELFGYDAGAFTGARKEGKPGLFELAHQGTLFLDEVGDMPAVLQAKLLRAIQEKEIMRLGGKKPIKVDVRIIAATHRNLTAMADEGRFRKDLYYRLMVVPIRLAPLKERKEDIPPLVMHFLDKYNKRFGWRKTIAPQVLDRLTEYPWPGNVRELENIIERMAVTAGSEVLAIEHLPEELQAKAWRPKKGTKLKEAAEQAEAYVLAESFKEHGSWQKVAEELQVDRATVYRKAKNYGLL